MKKRINKSISNFSFLLICSLCVVSIATAQTPQQIAQNAFKSTVSLESEAIKKERIPLGSGFFVKQNLIATNLHVVHCVLGNCYAKLVNQTNEYLIEGYTHIDVEHDLVILQVSELMQPHSYGATAIMYKSVKPYMLWGIQVD